MISHSVKWTGLFLVLKFMSVPVVQAGEPCVNFDQLVPHFSRELSLDPLKVEIKFTPLNLALHPGTEPERRAYLLSHEESCSLSGECDSVLFLRDEKECYRSVLSFRGKWKSLDRKKARGLASLEIISQVTGGEGAKDSSLRIRKGSRHFNYDAGRGRYEETNP